MVTPSPTQAIARRAQAQPGAQTTTDPSPAVQVRLKAFLASMEAAGMDEKAGQMRYDVTFKVPVLAADLPRLTALLAKDGTAQFTAQPTPADPAGVLQA